MHTITLFLFQMARLEGSISTYFGDIAVMPKRRRLTCEVRSIANLSPGPGWKKSRDVNEMEHSFINNQGNAEIDAHTNGSGYCLAGGIVAGQCR